MSEPLLPEPFEELESFADWALEPERARMEKRAASSTDEVRTFYDAMMLRINEILEHLESHFGGEMPGPAHRLYLMSLSLIEVATPVELSRAREGVATCDPLRYFPRF